MKMDRYIIAGGDHEICALNPNSKQKLSLKSDQSRVLGIYASSSCVYHAAELLRQESKKVSGRPKTFDVNYVQVFDSISGNPCLTITPPGSEYLPLEKRLAELLFSFSKEGDSLLYTLNRSRGVVFERCESEMELSGKTTFDDKRIYFEGCRITTLDEPVKFIREVSAEDFARSFRLRNKKVYKERKKTFFNLNPCSPARA